MAVVFTGNYSNKYHDNGLKMIFHTWQWYKDVFEGRKKPGGRNYLGTFVNDHVGNPCGNEPYTSTNWRTGEPSPVRLAQQAQWQLNQDEVLEWGICRENDRRFLEDTYYTEKKKKIDQKAADTQAAAVAIEAGETESYLRDLLKPANLNEQMDNIRTYIVQKLESKGMMPTGEGAYGAKRRLVDSIVTSALTRLQNYVLDEFTIGLPGVSRSSTTRSREVGQSLSAGSSGGGMTSTGLGSGGSGPGSSGTGNSF